MSASEETTNVLSVDARIVKTVRNLRKSSASKKSTPEMSQSGEQVKESTSFGQTSSNINLDNENKLQKEIVSLYSEEEKNNASSNASGSKLINYI